MKTSFLNSYLLEKRTKSISSYENNGSSQCHSNSKNLDYFMRMLEKKKNDFDNSKSGYFLCKSKILQRNDDKYLKRSSSFFEKDESNYVGSRLSSFLEEKKTENSILKRKIFKKSQEIFKIANFEKKPLIFHTSRDRNVELGSLLKEKDLNFPKKPLTENWQNKKNVLSLQKFHFLPLPTENALSSVQSNSSPAKATNSSNPKSLLFSKINDFSLFSSKGPSNPPNENAIHTMRSTSYSNSFQKAPEHSFEITVKKLQKFSQKPHKISSQNAEKISKGFENLNGFFVSKIRLKKRIVFKTMVNWFYKIKYQENEKIFSYFSFILQKIKKKTLGFAFFKFKIFKKNRQFLYIYKKKLNKFASNFDSKILKTKEIAWKLIRKATVKQQIKPSSIISCKDLIDLGKEILIKPSPCFKKQEKKIDLFERNQNCYYEKKRNTDENQEKIVEISFSNKENISFCEDFKQKTVKKTIAFDRKKKNLFENLERGKRDGKKNNSLNNDKLKSKIKERFIAEGNISAYKKIVNI